MAKTTEHTEPTTTITSSGDKELSGAEDGASAKEEREAHGANSSCAEPDVLAGGKRESQTGRIVPRSYTVTAGNLAGEANPFATGRGANVSSSSVGIFVPIMQKPPPLLAVVFPWNRTGPEMEVVVPWDRENGSRTMKKQDEVEVKDVGLATVGAIVGGTRSSHFALRCLVIEGGASKKDEVAYQWKKRTTNVKRRGGEAATLVT